MSRDQGGEPPTRGEAGSTVAGCRLVSLVGTGGSSTVWLAIDRANGARVAVKLLSGPLPPGERLRLRHEHLVGVQRVSQAPAAVVMDLAAGGSLASLVGARGPLDPGEVVTVVVAIATALRHLHGAGVVHGDVTGPNVLFAGDGRPLLGDLGTLRVAGAGPVAATARYVAPEILAGAVPAAAADVHGLCAAAWLALTGEPPSSSSRAPLSALAPAAPLGLVRVLTQGLDPDPLGRPSAAQLIEEAMAAATPMPVRLVGAAFPALSAPEAVTHRLREWSAQAAAASPAADPQTIGGRRPRAGGRRALSRRRRTLPWRQPAIMVVGGATFGVLVAGLAVGVRAFDASAAGLTSPAPAIASAPSPDATPLSPPSPASPPSPHARAPGAEQIRQVVAALVARRAEAFRSGDDAALLVEVYERESPASASDRAFIAANGPTPVAPVLGDVTVTLAEPTRAQVVAVVTMTVTGQESPPAEAVRLDLALTASGWRITGVTPADEP